MTEPDLSQLRHQAMQHVGRALPEPIATVVMFELNEPSGDEEFQGALSRAVLALPVHVVASPSPVSTPDPPAVHEHGTPPTPVAEDGRDAAIERALAEQLSRLVNPDLWQDTYSEWPNMVRSRERVIDAALIAVRAGWGPAVATREASVIAEVLDEYDGDHIINAAHVVAKIRAALNAAQSGGAQ